MDRRETLKAFTGGAALSAAASRDAVAQVAATAPQPAAVARDRSRAGGVPALKITDIKVFTLTVGTQDYINVKVYTSEPGLYGVGCGSHAEQRMVATVDTIENYFKPFLMGRDPSQIEKIWQELYVSPYWRNSAESNSAMTTIDGALWDIMGKRCGVPVHDLLGGKVRAGLRLLGGAGGRDLKAIEDSLRAQMADGYDHFRINAPAVRGGGETGDLYTVMGNDAEYIKGLVETYDYVRKNVSWDIEIGTDVHEKPTPRGAVMLAKAVEPFRPFFMEDLFSPEDVGWFKIVREQSSIGIAMGELFTNPSEWLPLVANRYIDLIRSHLACIGGLNVARKMAHTCEFFGVQTAWHGPATVSPIGHAVQLHLDLSIYNFGICEGGKFSDELKALYPGAPEVIKGIRYANAKPGLGVDLDEKLALKYPLGYKNGRTGMAHAERQDGAPWRP